jgi:phospholipase C
MRIAAAACVAATFIAGWIPGLAQKAARSTSSPTATPIKHLVVIFDENISFDHYFGTYPVALNPPHETPFKALPGTPRVNGLTAMLLERNPNFLNVKVNQSYAVNPTILTATQKSS